MPRLTPGEALRVSHLGWSVRVLVGRGDFMQRLHETDPETPSRQNFLRTRPAPVPLPLPKLHLRRYDGGQHEDPICPYVSRMHRPRTPPTPQNTDDVL